MKKLSRSEARKKAFELIFQSSMHQENLEELFIRLLEEQPECLDSMPYIRGVVLGVVEKQEELEQIIAAHLAKGWSLRRLSKMSLAILKLAVYEMLYVEDVPAKVAINEAVELSKTYGGDEEPVFINGVLGGVVKDYA